MTPIKIVNGSATVTIYEVKNKQWRNYHICWREGKTRMKLARSDKQEAIAEATGIAEKLSRVDHSPVEISKQELQYYKSSEQKLNGVPLHVAVDYYLSHTTEADHRKSRRLSLIVDEFLHHSRQHKEVKKMTALVHHLHTLCNTFTDTIDTISASALVDYFTKKGWGLAIQRQHLESIIALFRYAQRKHYLPEGPTAADAAERQLMNLAPTPKIYSPAETILLLKHVRPDGVPFLALGAFAGMRPNETLKLTWGDIDFGRKLINCGGGRFIRLLPNLISILRPFKKANKAADPVVPISQPHKEYTKKTVDAINAAEKNGHQWKENGLRNSFIAYHRARFGDPVATASITNSDVNAPAAEVSARDAKNYFAITDKTLALRK